MFAGGADAAEESAAPAPDQDPQGTLDSAPEETQAAVQPAEPEAQAGGADAAEESAGEVEIELELASEDMPATEEAGPETDTPEDSSAQPAEDDLVISEAALGQEEVAKLLGG